MLLSGCVATPLQVERVEFGQPIWTEGQRRAGVLFQDGAQTIAADGGSLWLFGDTFISKAKVKDLPTRAQIAGARGTTIAFLPKGQTNLPPQLDYFVDTNGVADYPFEPIPDESPAKYRIWPDGGVALGSRVYLYYSLIQVNDAKPAPWNFQGVGGGLAVADGPMKTFVRLRPDNQWRFPVEPIQVVRNGSALYLFEISEKPKGLILARVPIGKIEDPGAYEFYGGDGWSKNREDVKVILREAYGQTSVQWVPDRERYLMATSSDFSHPKEIQLRESRALEGPWSKPVRIAVPDFPKKKTNLVYCTYLHPELTAPGSLRLVATFCRILDGDWELSNPEWVTITLKP
jgi:hypothetical protein